MAHAAVHRDALQWLWNWFEHITGANNEAGPWYGFWSGFGGSFLAPNMAIFGTAFLVLRHHNCHVKGCWRIRTHPVFAPDGRQTPYQACRKHHPHLDDNEPVTPSSIATWHERHPAPT